MTAFVGATHSRILGWLGRGLTVLGLFIVGAGAAEKGVPGPEAPGARRVALRADQGAECLTYVRYADTAWEEATDPGTPPWPGPTNP